MSNVDGKTKLAVALQQTDCCGPTCSDTVSQIGGADVIHPDANP